MHEIPAKVTTFLTYLSGAFTAFLGYLGANAAGIGALVTILMFLATLWFKAQHLKLAKEQHKSVEGE